LIVIETERLYLKEFSLSDAESMYALNLDPEVLKYTGDEPFNSIEEARDFIENYKQYQLYGFGRWSVFIKERNEYIGWCGLKYTEDKNEYDIGFRFLKEHWNKGFATETAAACLNFGFENLQIDRIVGRAMSVNFASIKVLEKIGMQFNREFDFDGEPGVIYEIDRG
jgi:[ribosomal protein S5]-alanine N-acetyltransferase